MSLNKMLMGYMPTFILSAIEYMNNKDPQVTMNENSHYSHGPTGRRVGKRQRMTCRPQYHGNLNPPGHFDK